MNRTRLALIVPPLLAAGLAAALLVPRPAAVPPPDAASLLLQAQQAIARGDLAGARGLVRRAFDGGLAGRDLLGFAASLALAAGLPDLAEDAALRTLLLYDGGSQAAMRWLMEAEVALTGADTAALVARGDRFFDAASSGRALGGRSVRSLWYLAAASFLGACVLGGTGDVDRLVAALSEIGWTSLAEQFTLMEVAGVPVRLPARLPGRQVLLARTAPGPGSSGQETTAGATVAAVAVAPATPPQPAVRSPRPPSAVTQDGRGRKPQNGGGNQNGGNQDDGQGAASSKKDKGSKHRDDKHKDDDHDDDRGGSPSGSGGSGSWNGSGVSGCGGSSSDDDTGKDDENRKDHKDRDDRDHGGRAAAPAARPA